MILFVCFAGQQFHGDFGDLVLMDADRRESAFRGMMRIVETDQLKILPRL